MMSTSLGTPLYPYFLDNFALSSFKDTFSLASCAFISSAAIEEVTRSRISAWDGPNGDVSQRDDNRLASIEYLLACPLDGCSRMETR